VAGQPELSFAGLLRQLRVEADLTQEELAEAASLSPRSVSDLERGINRTARRDTARLLAGALGLGGPASELFVAAARGRLPAQEVLAACGGAVPAALVARPRPVPCDVAGVTGHHRGADPRPGCGTLRVTMLGGFGVGVADRPVPRAWRLRKSKTLVKLLALADGHRAHRDVLTEALWPGMDPAAAANNLHQALHAARRALTVDGSAPADVLRLRDNVVILSPSGGVVIDADEFAAAGQRALRSRSAEDYQAALDLYAGELLPEDRNADWAAADRERLAGLHRSLRIGLARNVLERGDPAEAVLLLGPLARSRPDDEPVHRLLIEALNQAGRRWDALDAYERLRKVLDEEYAALPEPATQSLYRRILSAQGPAGAAVASNLPTAVTRFIGRRREMTELLALQQRARLVTLCGPGGVGKTRLAVEVARQLATSEMASDGVWLVDLSGARDGRLVPTVAAACLGMAVGGAELTTAALVRQLADRKAALLLDNCEHLLGAAADFAGMVLESCPGVRVIATSREPFRIPGEVVWRVSSLELPDPEATFDLAPLGRLESVQLFLERARCAAPRFQLDASTGPAVARICLRLDGMPLALELAASRLAHLAPGELAARLDDALGTLAVRLHGVPDRQATLAATLDWSHDLLDDDERAVFRRLSVFAAGCTLDAAEDVCAGGLHDPVAAIMSRLVDKSLVAADMAGDQARFRLLEVVRQYAAGQLASAGELTGCGRRHALWFAGHAESLDPDDHGGVVGEPSAWFGVEAGNLRAALSTCLREMPDRALAIALAAWRAWMARGLHAEGLHWLTQALRACPASSERRARALYAAAVLEVRVGRVRHVAAIGAEIVELADVLGDPRLRSDALHQHSLLAWLAAEWDQARRLAGQASAAARDIPGVRASHDHLRAVLALSRSDTSAAQELLDGSLTALDQIPPEAPPFFAVCTLSWSVDRLDGLLLPVFEETMLVGRRVGAAQGRGYALATQAMAARMGGHFGDAGTLLDRALRVFEAARDRAGQAYVLAQRGHLHRERRDPAAARQCFRSAMDLRAVIPDQRGTAIALTGLALAEAALGNGDRARALGREACRVLDRSGDVPGYHGALNNLAVAEALSGRPAQATDAIERSLTVASEYGAARSVGWQYTLLAALRQRSGDRAAADAARTAARERFQQIGERRGLDAIADLDRQGAIAEGGRVKAVQSLRP
jgi:predicted ATPase/DNA-binding SARP family transcriptional activator/transcriptional regulator with XRE-family HTH domain